MSARDHVNVGMLDGLPSGRAAVNADVQPDDIAVTGKLAAHLAHEPQYAQPLLVFELLNARDMASRNDQHVAIGHRKAIGKRHRKGRSVGDR